MAQTTVTQIYWHEGKKYRLADHRDIGKEVYFDDLEDISEAIGYPCRQELEGIIAGTAPYQGPTDTWKYAFVELEAPVPAVVSFNGTLEVGQWYETNADERLYCNSRTHHDTYPMVMAKEDGCVETYMEKGLWIEDHDMDDEDSIALHLVGCTGFDWPKPVPPALAPEPVDTRPDPPAGWRYVAEDEVLVDGDQYMKAIGVVDSDVRSGIGSTVAELQKQGQAYWASYWVGIIRKMQKELAQSAVTEVINDLCKTIHEKQKATGWWDAADNPLVVPTKLALVVSEVAEALEGHRRGLKDDKLPEYDMIAVELADVLIRVFDLAGFLGIELGTIMEAKEKFNSSRSDHKPENRKAVAGKKY